VHRCAQPFQASIISLAQNKDLHAVPSLLTLAMMGLFQIELASPQLLTPSAHIGEVCNNSFDMNLKEFVDKCTAAAGAALATAANNPDQRAQDIVTAASSVVTTAATTAMANNKKAMASAVKNVVTIKGQPPPPPVQQQVTLRAHCNHVG
jgi:hypothetical protein